jgi:hypothetical protein
MCISSYSRVRIGGLSRVENSPIDLSELDLFPYGGRSGIGAGSKRAP